MVIAAIASWPALLALGAFHGINPGMGWLFAVALGMQEGRRRAVWRSLLPLALGHALAIGATVAVAAAIEFVLPIQWLQWAAALVLIGLGAARLRRHRHPRMGGMRVTMASLTMWSFVMASAHGAGLMVLPFVLTAGPSVETVHAAHARHGTHGVEAAQPAIGDPLAGILAATVHGLGYLLITAIVALIVYERVGVGIIRKTWINLDLLWAFALIATGGLTLLMDVT